MIRLQPFWTVTLASVIALTSFTSPAQPSTVSGPGDPANGVSMQPLITTEGGPATAHATVPAGRTELFNGKDFSGWIFCSRTNTDPTLTWTVTNGVMHCTGQPYGYARTDKNFRDYKLTVEWRFVKVAPRADNTGVFVHVQPPDRVWPKCIECQGQYQHQGNLILMGGATCKGHATPESRAVRALAPQHEKAAGEWNTYEIESAGDRLKVYVNGRLMNEATECSLRSGAIAIQSEGGEFEVRKVLLEPLPAE